MKILFRVVDFEGFIDCIFIGVASEILFVGFG